MLPIEQSLDRVMQWVESHDYKAYDPGDGQLSPLRRLTFGRQPLKRALTAAILRVPFNVRPLLGIPPHASTKGIGYMAWGYAKRYAQTGNRHYLEQGRFGLDWLIEQRARGQKHYCWGNEFDFSTRAGTIPAHEPTIVWSSLIGQAFLEGYRTFEEPKYLAVAVSIADWILSLPREKTSSGSCISYVAFYQSSIHNSSMLGAALLAAVGKLTGKAEALELAADAMKYSCTRVNADGSWYYGEHPKYHWIDNFHTGYNLDSLKRYTLATGDHSFDDQMQQAFAYFKKTFFESDGRPRYYYDRIYPTDIQCTAQAIDTLAFFSDEDSGALELAKLVADWTIANMQDPDGHFYYRDLGWTMNKTPMLHWGQGTMFKALAHLLGKLKPKPANLESANGELRIADSRLRAGLPSSAL